MKPPGRRIKVDALVHGTFLNRFDGDGIWRFYVLANCMVFRQ